ncbi:LOW QUALITY PROTEIN: olfactory receptor 149-like [Physeter macrocephalus]|uniref:LOW QUALITY PROTEIN: olfactory receptor 149-like n=1 Tax=Physeter macrocephalus TaxID=9755 RepID=A0A2Y9TFL1_PHYMC|nr:LOW QUALITY PROTEIN: olfactory receptor 149-like [Physeter catodon]|eukprot:XP_023986949.1 LOW QUALITY PROTEIN: olfactory receptor 149-like [Physeter catodon]
MGPFSRSDFLTGVRNAAVVTEFILLGIPHTEHLETMLFVLFLSFCLFTLTENLLILLAVVSSIRLHTPMYFFLCKLSVCDIFFPSGSSPKMLFYLSGNSRAISYAGYMSQRSFYHFLGCTECFLYTVMAYDRFVAICYRLRNTIIVSHRVYAILAMETSFFGCIQATFLTTLTFQLSFCGPNEVDCFFCDIPVMLKLACADTSALEMAGFISVGLMPLSCFLLILTSYSRIVYSILQIHSAEGQWHAFSTCSAHLTAILLFYMPVVLIYLRLTPSPWMDATVQILNNLVTPMLNHLIYSLRDKEVKSSLRKVLHQLGFLPEHCRERSVANTSTALHSL